MISRKLTFAVLLLVGIITIGQSQTSSFPPKPANKWQLGLNLGVPQILGDIKSEPFGGNHTPAFGVGLNIRKSLGYLLSMRLHGMYGTAYGQDFVHLHLIKHLMVHFQTAQMKTTQQVPIIPVTFGYQITKRP